MKKTAMQQIKSIIIGLKSKGQEIDANELEDWINRVGEPMEKEQIMDAWNKNPQGFNHTAEQYDNETFKSE